MIINKNKRISSTKSTHHIHIEGKIYHYSDDTMKMFNARTLNNIKRRAKKLSLPCTLTIASLREWWLTTPDVCTYCNSTLDEYLKIRTFIIQYTGNDPTITRFKSMFSARNNHNMNSMTLHRVDNTKGYTLDNLCKSCPLCNHIKGDYLTSNEWKIIAPMIMSKLKTKVPRATGFAVSL